MVSCTGWKKSSSPLSVHISSASNLRNGVKRGKNFSLEITILFYFNFVILIDSPTWLLGRDDQQIFIIILQFSKRI